MLVSQIYVPMGRVPDVAAALTGTGWVDHVVVLGPTTDNRFELISAEVNPHGIDQVVDALETAGVAPADITVHRLSPLQPGDVRGGRSWFGGDPDDFVWMQLLGQARRSVRLFGRYVALMMVAGVIAAIGVVARNDILIVGAMAVSPDLLPVCGACVGIVARRPRLLGRAAGTLVIGLAMTTVAAAALVALLRSLGELHDFELGNSEVRQLTSVNYSTIVIALAAGVAALLAFETNATAAVGVAISVTTIPAAAYMGVAWVTHDAWRGAFDVLAVNVVLLVVAGSLTLGVQRLLHRQTHPRIARVTSSGSADPAGHRV